MQRYLFALTVLLFSSQLNAVDIQLNNGRIIQADKVWQFANKTHVLRGKQITSLDHAHIKRIITTQHPNSLDTRKPRFEFDRWTSGIDIEDIIDTAREHNLPIKLRPGSIQRCGPCGYWNRVNLSCAGSRFMRLAPMQV